MCISIILALFISNMCSGNVITYLEHYQNDQYAKIRSKKAKQQMYGAHK